MNRYMLASVKMYLKKKSKSPLCICSPCITYVKETTSYQTLIDFFSALCLIHKSIFIVVGMSLLSRKYFNHIQISLMHKIEQKNTLPY